MRRNGRVLRSRTQSGRTILHLQLCLFLHRFLMCVVSRELENVAFVYVGGEFSVPMRVQYPYFRRGTLAMCRRPFWAKVCFSTR